MDLATLKKPASRRDLRVFAGLQFLFFLVILTLWHGRNWPTGAWATAAGSLAVSLLGLLWPDAIRWLYRAWMTAVFPIGWLVSHTAMAAVYYLVVTPIGLFRRTTAGDPMQRSFDRDAATYWQPRRAPRDPLRYFRQF